MTLILIAIAWMLGVVVGDGRTAAPAAIAVVAVGAAVLAALVGRRLPRGGLALALLAAALAGAWRGAVAQPETTEQSVWLWAGARVTVEGVVAEEPRWTEVEQRLVLEVEALLAQGQARPAHGRLLVALPAEPRRRVGERLVVEGLLAEPASSEEFDYAGYLARRSIFVLLERPIVRASIAPDASARGAILGLKERAHQAILHLLPEPEASLLAGILLGLQSALPPDLYDDFSVTGTSHILVISGWNISITIAGVLWLTGKLRLRRWPATLAALGVVVLYVALVGASAAVVRSSIMGAVVALASPLHRRSDPWTALALACMLMTMLDPNVLWDLGFQLSAGAVAGLFAGGGAAKRGCEWLLRPRLLRWAADPLSATLAAQVFTLPLLLYRFGRLSIIAPLANVALLPAVPLAMALGALMTILALIWEPLGFALLLPAWLPLAWLTRGARHMAALPLAATTVPPFSIWWLLAYYIVVVGAMLAYHDWREARALARHDGGAGP